jgi:TatD DNase family protein
MINLCDSHTHVDQYDNAELPGIIERALSHNVTHIIAAGTTLKSTEKCISLANQYPMIYAGTGIHPSEVTELLDEKQSLLLYSMITNNDKVVCMSEIGLDYLPESPNKALQQQVFREQIRIAIATNKPIIFHSRESHEDVFNLLKEEQAFKVGGIMHYFQSDIRTALQAIDLGFYISIARPLLRIPELQTTVKHIPLSNMVLETDCYPQPFKKNRQSWTEPRPLMDIASHMALIKNISIEEVGNTTTANLKSLVKF